MTPSYHFLSVSYIFVTLKFHQKDLSKLLLPQLQILFDILFVYVVRLIMSLSSPFILKLLSLVQRKKLQIHDILLLFYELPLFGSKTTVYPTIKTNKLKKHYLYSTYILLIHELFHKNVSYSLFLRLTIFFISSIVFI